ncbi:MAG: hypothetical protein M1383_06310 [Patescibacteria group bacterium]|nr:hypothetical protein [Patescibacteria group bacterium]
MLIPNSAAETNSHDQIGNETNNQAAAFTGPVLPAGFAVPKTVPKDKGPGVATDLKSPAGDAAVVREYLEAAGSPLAPYADQIAQSDFWAVLIGICTIEQYGCTKAPDWNYWGMMLPGGGLRKFESAEEAIAFMDAYFIRLYESRKTVESLRGYYCASACTNWEPTVVRVKRLLESK